MATTMANITINNRDYDLDSLCDEARAQLTSLQFVGAELKDKIDGIRRGIKFA